MLEELRQMGLTEYEAKVYSALLCMRTATGGRIAEESEVPHGKAYASLHSLAGKGLITIVPVEPKLFKLVDPKAGMRRLVKRKAEALEEAEARFLDSVKHIGPAAEETAVEKLEIYAGSQRQFEVGESLMARAKRQLLIILFYNIYYFFIQYFTIIQLNVP